MSYAPSSSAWLISVVSLGFNGTMVGQLRVREGCAVKLQKLTPGSARSEMSSYVKEAVISFYHCIEIVSFPTSLLSFLTYVLSLSLIYQARGSKEALCVYDV